LRLSLTNTLPRVSFFVFCKADAPQLAHSVPNLNDDREPANKEQGRTTEQQELSADALLEAARNYVLVDLEFSFFSSFYHSSHDFQRGLKRIDIRT